VADFKDILEKNPQAFEGTTHSDNYAALATKLGELGFDVLINDKKAAEFVPASRLNDVVSQRDTFKGQVEGANRELEQMKIAAKDNEPLKLQLQTQIDQNNGLLKDLETTNVKMHVVMAAKDAIDANDLFHFIKMDNIRVTNKGDVVGVDAEVERLRKEKPHLFASPDSKRKGGMDHKGDKSEPALGGGMNSLLRRAAGIQVR